MARLNTDKIQIIVKNLKSGEMYREIDMKHTGGFWDFALHVMDCLGIGIDDVAGEQTLIDLYETFYQIYEQTNKRKDGAK